jgi:hypothetical protein
MTDPNTKTEITNTIAQTEEKTNAVDVLKPPKSDELKTSKERSDSRDLCRRSRSRLGEPG